MAMSDCPKCWSTPCECGHEYEGWTKIRLLRQIRMLERVLANREGESEVAVDKVTRDILDKIKAGVADAVRDNIFELGEFNRIDVYVKPEKSVEFIQLRFTLTSEALDIREIAQND